MTLTADDVGKILQDSLKEGLLEYVVREFKMGTKAPKTYKEIWIKIDRNYFRKAVETIFSINYPHLHFITGEDRGDVIEMIYSFGLFYSVPWGEVNITLKFDLPKDDLTVPTITDLMMGAETNEREIREMLGIEFEGLKKKRHLFLPDDWPEGKYPWRKDEYGVEDMIKYTHKSVNEIRSNRGETNERE